MFALPISALVTLPIAVAIGIVVSKTNRGKSTRQKAQLFIVSVALSFALLLTYNWIVHS